MDVGELRFVVPLPWGDVVFVPRDMTLGLRDMWETIKYVTGVYLTLLGLHLGRFQLEVHLSILDGTERNTTHP